MQKTIIMLLVAALLLLMAAGGASAVNWCWDAGDEEGIYVDQDVTHYQYWASGNTVNLSFYIYAYDEAVRFNHEYGYGASPAGCDYTYHSYARYWWIGAGDTYLLQIDGVTTGHRVWSLYPGWGDNQVRVTLVVTQEPSYTVSGDVGCISNVDLYMWDGSTYLFLDDYDSSVNNNYTFPIINNIDYRLVFSDGAYYDFTCDGNEVVDYDACLYVYGYTCGVGDIHLYVDDGGWVLEDTVSQSMLLSDYEMVIESGKDYTLNMHGISQLVDTYPFSCAGDHVLYSHDRCIYPPGPHPDDPVDPIIIWEGYNYNIVVFRDEHGNRVENAQVAIYDQTNTTYIQKWTPNPDGYLLLGALFNDSDHAVQILTRTFDGVFTLGTTYPANGSFGGAYRKPITLIGGTSGAQTNYQLNLSVQYEFGMQTDFDDLRFTQSDGVTSVDAWLGSKADGMVAEIWVEFPTTPANGIEQTYYMYYGNTSAVSDWDGDATFIQYHGAATVSFIDPLIALPSSYVCECYGGVTSAGSYIEWGVSNTQTRTDDAIGILSAQSTGLRYIVTNNEGATGSLSEAPDFTNGTKYKLRMERIAGEVYGYVDDNQIGVGAVTSNLPNENLGLFMYTRTSTGMQDWSFVRKYAANPATYTFGSEQILTPPTTEDVTLTNMTIPIHYNIQMDTHDQYGVPLTDVFCGLSEYTPLYPLSFWGMSMGGRQYVPVTNCSGFAMCDIYAEKGGYRDYNVTALNWTSRSAMVKNYFHEIVMVKE